MRYLVFLVFVVAGLWSFESMALDLPMKFRIKTIGQSNGLEKSVVWNPATQEAMIRMGVVPVSIDPFLDANYVNFMEAQEVHIVTLENPELDIGCDQVSQWQFEYRPGLPDYLLFITLKGPNCQQVADTLELYNTRFRFLKASTQSDPVDVALEISR